MRYRTVLLHCLIQSEMLFCLKYDVFFSISSMLLTLTLLIYSLLHLSHGFCRRNKNISVLCHPLKQMGGKDLILHHWNQGSAAAEWMHRHIKLMVQKNIHTFASQWSLSSGPSGLQHPPLLASTAGVEGKWLFKGCSSTLRATADTHALQNTICFFMQCMTEGSWSSESFQDLNSLIQKDLLFLSRFWKLIHCYWTRLSSQLKNVIHQPSLCLLLNPEGSWNPLGGMIITLKDCKDVFGIVLENASYKIKHTPHI